MRYLVIIATIFLSACAADAERYEYRSDVNQVIPDFDSTGITDTILVPEHILIEDINFFVGIGSVQEPWAEDVWIDVYSPEGGSVRLNGWDTPRIYWYYVWYDTDREEDGPGNLDDYIGLDAYGPWSMHAFDMFPDWDLTWNYWKVEVIGEPVTEAEENPTGIPQEFRLLGNHPNPFNSNTVVQFGLPVEAAVRIEIFDVLGRLVRNLADGTYSAGYHSIVWDGRDNAAAVVSSGVYVLTMKVGDRSFDKRMVMIK